jgi:hypothetical protein
MFFCHAAESITKSLRSGKVAVMTKLQLCFKAGFLSAVTKLSESAWAVGAEVAAAQPHLLLEIGIFRNMTC